MNKLVEQQTVVYGRQVLENPMVIKRVSQVAMAEREIIVMWAVRAVLTFMTAIFRALMSREQEMYNRGSVQTNARVIREHEVGLREEMMRHKVVSKLRACDITCTESEREWVTKRISGYS
ncbi:hypothetical protein V1512DRAFT_249600 [Lipomyces arxii]|uniref:uncharacterized protein n=1 Tax=Lipomyces arxii TaxID=56418 RepID=UPI0034CED7E5